MMFPEILIRLLGLFLLSGLLVLGCATGKLDNPKPVIKLHDVLSESQGINNSIAKFIIEKGYGYPVEIVVESTPAMQDALPKGAVDLNLEGWQQNIIEWYRSEMDKGSIINLGMIYEGGPQFFMMPQWVSESYGIKTVQDMKDQWQVFQDPQDPSKGVFYNCISGWECAKINQAKLSAYGLDEVFNVVSPASADALKAALEDAQKAKRPVFGYYWQPSPLAAAYSWHVLEEPAHTTACWNQVIAAADSAAADPPEAACAYENLPIDKLAHAGLPEKAPELVEMLKAMVVGLEPLNSTMAWSEENNVEDKAKVAVYFLQNYEDRWRDWVTPEAHRKIKDALEKAGSAGQ
jgi:glycine betaine/proline transport system substrate-binding protein